VQVSRKVGTVNASNPLAFNPRPNHEHGELQILNDLLDMEGVPSFTIYGVTLRHTRDQGVTRRFVESAGKRTVMVRGLEQQYSTILPPPPFIT